MPDTQIQDAIIRHTLDLHRLSEGNEAQAEALLRQLADDLAALMARPDISLQSKRDMAALIKDASEAIQARYQQLASIVDSHGIAIVVSEQAAQALQSIAPSAAALSAERLASLSNDILIYGNPASSWWKQQATATAFRFAGAVRMGALQGQTIQQIAKAVTEPGGILQVSRSQATGLVHSSIMAAANSARFATFAKAGKNVAGVKWLSTLDSHTCKTCGNLDGQAWDFDGNKLGKTWMEWPGPPPRHFACRCILTPALQTRLDEIFGKSGLDAALAPTGRASSSGFGPNVTFAEFLNRQSPEFVAGVLGAKRAEAFLAGRITLKDLVTRTGRPLTLAQLRLQSSAAN